MYKLACATRADRPMMDTSGPWIQPTPWPYITWDLNVQLCYWPVCASGRVELGNSLVDALYKNQQALIDNVRPEEWQHDSAMVAVVSSHDLREPRNGDMRYYDCVGNLTWALHNCWLIYRHCMDEHMLAQKIFPLLRRSVNLYFHLCEQGDDGRIHLPPTYSPEYNQGKSRSNPDCNYDLALFRWGCRTLIDICRRLNRDDPLMDRWKDVLDRLTPFSEDETGLTIARGVPMSYSHRHYSHLLMIYPLYLLNVEQEENRDLIEKSLLHWISFEGALMGYSFTGASSISAAMGNGNKSLEYLEGLYPFLLPNGMYKEAGPVMETPLSAAQCIHDMLIQSWGNVVRVFPAVPDAWQNLCFYRLRAEGAFEISAERRNGTTLWVSVKSLAGEPLVIKPGLGTSGIKIKVARGDTIGNLESADGLFPLQLDKGQQVILTAAE